jgi:hypothetical protein
VPPGTWAVRIDGSGGAVTPSVVDTDTGDSFSLGEGSTFRITGGAPVHITISLWTMERTGAHVREVVLERAPDAIPSDAAKRGGVPG